MADDTAVKSIEDLLTIFSRQKGNVEVLADGGPDGRILLGVRVRFYGKELKGRMCLASGDTLHACLVAALDKCRAGRLEPVDFERRPWATGGTHAAGWD